MKKRMTVAVALLLVLVLLCGCGIPEGSLGSKLGDKLAELVQSTNGHNPDGLKFRDLH